jgi:hypothetical protein
MGRLECSAKYPNSTPGVTTPGPAPIPSFMSPGRPNPPPLQDAGKGVFGPLVPGAYATRLSSEIPAGWRLAKKNIPGSQSDQLRNAIEVTVTGVERQIMLERQRPDPNVVGWNRRGLCPQLLKQASIVVSGLFVGE